MPGGSTCRMPANPGPGPHVKRTGILTIVLNAQDTGKRDRINLQQGQTAPGRGGPCSLDDGWRRPAIAGDLLAHTLHCRHGLG